MTLQPPLVTPRGWHFKFILEKKGNIRKQPTHTVFKFTEMVFVCNFRHFLSTISDWSVKDVILAFIFTF